MAAAEERKVPTGWRTVIFGGRLKEGGSDLIRNHSLRLRVWIDAV